VLLKVMREPMDSDEVVTIGLSSLFAYAGPAQEATAALGRLAPGTPAAGEVSAALIEVLRSGPPRRRGAAAQALGHFPGAAAAAVSALAAFLREAASSSQPTRDAASAAEALGNLAPGTTEAAVAVEALTAALKSASPPTRESALEALQSFKPATTGAIEAVRAIASDDPSADIRQTAISTLVVIDAATQ